MTGDGARLGRRIAEGREAEIFEWDEGLVLRLARGPEWAASVALGSAASEAARTAGVRTPRVVETVEIDGRPGQVLERVDGPDLFAVLGANPLRLPTIARRLAEVHVGLHRVVAPAALPSTRDELARRIDGSPLVPPDLRVGALELLGDLPDGDRLCHGDFHPGNVLDAADGPTLIDWTNATRGDPASDFARTVLTLRVGEVPPGAPGAIRMLAVIGRGALWRGYRRAYLGACGLDTGLVHRWTHVAAANRLAEGIESERPALLRLLSTGFPQR